MGRHVSANLEWVLEQLLDINRLYWQWHSETIDGFTAFWTAGSITVGDISTDLATGAVVNDTTVMFKTVPTTVAAGNYFMRFDRRIIFDVLYNIPAITTHIVYMVVGDAGAGTTTSQFGFKVLNGGIYGCCADGTTQRLTAKLADTGVDFIHTLKAICIPNQQVDFYIDGVFQARLTANLPTTTDNVTCFMYASIETTAAAARTLSLHRWRFKYG